MMRWIPLFLIFFVLFPTISVQARRGCCSHHGGISYCDTQQGRYVCRDGTYSPSCGCMKVTPPEKKVKQKEQQTTAKQQQ